MSTKAIEECIRAWGDGDECALRARAEFEAIQKAAIVIARADVGILGFLTVEEIDEAVGVMESIAEDAHGR